VTPAQVRARLEKRTRRCDDRPGTFPSEVVRGSCPGWAIATRGSSFEVIACYSCNVYASLNHRITDQHARMISEAESARLAACAAAERRRREDATTYHWYDGGSRGVARSGALCATRLGFTRTGRRQHIGTQERARVNCTKCRRLLAETFEQRAEREMNVRARLTQLKSKKQAEREEQRALLHALIEEARPLAMVALDAHEEGWKHPELSRLLSLSVAAYRDANTKSRGDGLWVHTFAAVQRGYAWAWCRFCRERMCEEHRPITIGEDISDTTFLAEYGEHVHVGQHTTRCALRYLAGDLAPKVTTPSASE